MKLERFVSKKGAESWVVGYRTDKLNGVRNPAQRELGVMTRDAAIKAAMSFAMKALDETVHFVPVEIELGEGHDLVAFLLTTEQLSAFKARVKELAKGYFADDYDAKAEVDGVLGDAAPESSGSSTKPEPATLTVSEPAPTAAEPAPTAAPTAAPEPAPKPEKTEPAKTAKTAKPEPAKTKEKHGR